jgi:hypothetical protein
MASRIERILILAKTYPSPSSQYVETSCVAGVTDSGCMRRLYPVPFRLIEHGHQFKKWQWIDVRVEKASKDRRPESHRVFVDTVELRDRMNTNHGWRDRRSLLDRLPTFTDFGALDRARLDDGVSLALLKPARILGLEISKARNTDWTAEEREKLMRDQMDLFSEAEAKAEVRELRKVPYDFHYRYSCDTPDGPVEHCHKIVDWEAGQLYWNCVKSHGPVWEEPFRKKLETELIGKDLMFFMGNMHRFQAQWLIVSLIYPPKLAPHELGQGQLF